MIHFRSGYKNVNNTTSAIETILAEKEIEIKDIWIAIWDTTNNKPTGGTGTIKIYIDRGGQAKEIIMPETKIALFLNQGSPVPIQSKVKGKIVFEVTTTANEYIAYCIRFES